jgi:hypothetical protein
MAKKSRPRSSPSPQPARRTPLPSKARRRRHPVLIGGAILALVLGVGITARWLLYRQVPVHLQGAVEGHFTRGVAEAPVVVKEFSDYT